MTPIHIRQQDYFESIRFKDRKIEKYFTKYSIDNLVGFIHYKYSTLQKLAK